MASTAVKAMEKNKAKLKYSNMECKLLDLLAKGGIVSSEELVEKVYDGMVPPFTARHSVTSVMRSLIRKIELNDESFTITKTKQSGPYPTQYRKIPRRK